MLDSDISLTRTQLTRRMQRQRMNVDFEGTNESIFLETSTQSLPSILSSPLRPRKVKRYDSSPTVLTKAMISKAFPKRLPRKGHTANPLAPLSDSCTTKAALSESFTSICVENGLSSPAKRPITRLSPRRTRSTNVTSTPRNRKHCLPKSQLVISAVSVPPLPVAMEGSNSRNSNAIAVLPEKDTSIDKASIQAYDEHKKHFAKCRPSRRRVQFSEKIDDGPKPSTARVNSISVLDLSLPVVSPSSADNALFTNEEHETSSSESTSCYEVERLHQELSKACRKIDQLLEVLASEDEESRRLAAENDLLRRRLRRRKQNSTNRRLVVSG